jgi:hypothetical protein
MDISEAPLQAGSNVVLDRWPPIPLGAAALSRACDSLHILLSEARLSFFVFHRTVFACIVRQVISSRSDLPRSFPPTDNNSLSEKDPAIHIAVRY